MLGCCVLLLSRFTPDYMLQFMAKCWVKLDPTSASGTMMEVSSLMGSNLTNGYGSIPINTIFNGMNNYLPAILMFTRGTTF